MEGRKVTTLTIGGLPPSKVSIRAKIGYLLGEISNLGLP